jgi:hypothetical protein
MRPVKCKVCGTEYARQRLGQKTCSVPCAISMAKSETARKEKRAAILDRKETRDKLKTRADWAREAQAAVNKYVRLRDSKRGCVSCDKPASWDGQWHASHFRSVGASSATRFHLWNIHKACSICNNWKSGNLSEYEPRLRDKIGNDKVDWIRAQTQPVKYTVEYLDRIKRVFQKKCKRLESRL